MRKRKNIDKNPLPRVSNQPLDKSERIQSEEDVLAEEMLELDAEDSQWARSSLVTTARALLARGTKRTTVAGIYGEDIVRDAEAAPRPTQPVIPPPAPR